VAITEAAFRKAPSDPSLLLVNMPSPGLKWAGSLDMYRKIPVDLMEGTKRGSVFSYVALTVMILLFFMETGAFFSSQ
jgi:hypothetical protein